MGYECVTRTSWVSDGVLPVVAAGLPPNRATKGLGDLLSFGRLGLGVAVEEPDPGRRRLVGTRDVGDVVDELRSLDHGHVR
jgi:hypothetical protein